MRCSAGSAESARCTRSRSCRCTADSMGRGGGSGSSRAEAATARSALPRERRRSRARLLHIAMTNDEALPRRPSKVAARRHTSMNASCTISSASDRARRIRHASASAVEAVGLAVASGEIHHDAPGARHFFVLVGDGETAFGVAELAVRFADDGIDEPEEAFALLLRRLALLCALLDVDGDDVLMHADLRGGKADAVRLVHGLGHVVAELADGGIDRAYGLGLLLEPGIGPDEDL